MSFLSRLGLQSVSFSEHNHGDSENIKQHDFSSDTLVDGDASPIQLAEADDDEESRIPQVLVTEGAVFQHDLIVVMPDYEVHFFNENTYKNTIEVFKVVLKASIQLVCTVRCDFFVGFDTVENRKVIGKVHYLATGTHVFKLDPSEDGFMAEYDLL